jgi:hypothetical protein
MPKYIVSVPIAGSASFEVEAKSRKEAKEKVWDVINADVAPDVTWDYYSKLTPGNVLHARQNEIEVSEP